MRLPSQPWRSPATARAGCPPPAPSGAAGWSRWCPVRRWGCALCSCRWRSLRPGGRTGRGVVTWCEAEDVFLLSLFSAATFSGRPADSAVRPLNAFCKHISWAWVIPSRPSGAPRSTLKGGAGQRLDERNERKCNNDAMENPRLARIEVESAMTGLFISGFLMRREKKKNHHSAIFRSL